MGIHGLFKFVADSAPLSVKETKVESYTGRTVAVDASMCLYQFLVAVRQGDQQSNLSNAAGDVTSHIQGFLGRTVKLLELGIKPVYVFDGKPPELKSKELAGRQQKKAEAAAELEAAIASGDAEEIRKQAARTSRATPQMNADVQELLKLLGCPVVLAPSEAEASCAALVKAGKAYATVTEDMDALTFGSCAMLKNFFDTESSRSGTKKPVYELKLPTLLEQLDVTMEAFVDFCILCGCDYCGTIKGVGPATAFKLLKTHGSIEKAIASLDEGKRPTEEEMPYEEARHIFANPEVVDAPNVTLVWGTPDFNGLTKFLVERHSFNEQRVQKYCDRLKACRASGTQMRLDSFFKVGQPKAVPDGAKFDPFAKKSAGASGSGSKRAGKQPVGGGGKKAKR